MKMIRRIIDFLQFKKYLEELEAIYKAVTEMNNNEI